MLQGPFKMSLAALFSCDISGATIFSAVIIIQISIFIVRFENHFDWFILANR